MHAAELAFWLPLGLLLYTYLGYPALLAVWSRLRPAGAATAAAEPKVTVIVVAYNEARRMAPRIANILNSDYPSDRLEVMVGCDGATDATALEARRFGRNGVRVMEFARRRGKSAVLNDLVPRANGEIVVLADARQRFAPTALRRLVAGFSDPRVGAVSGELVLLPAASRSQVGEGSGFYWRYETFIRRKEALVDSMVGATGPIYAIRRALFRPLPPILLDDVLLPLSVVRQGYRVLYEPRALAYDRVVETARAEFKRKLRTIGGYYQLFAAHPWVLLPGANRIWFQTLSHKGLRLLGPACLASTLAASIALSGSPAYRVALILQVLFYGAAVIGRAMRDATRRAWPFNIAYVFCMLNLATLLAVFRFARRGARATWEPTRG